MAQAYDTGSQCASYLLEPTLVYRISSYSFRTFMYCDQRPQYIRPKSKKNSFRGNYMRKYGIKIGKIKGLNQDPIK